MVWRTSETREPRNRTRAEVCQTVSWNDSDSEKPTACVVSPTFPTLRGVQGENSALLPTSGLLKCERKTVKGAEHLLALDGVELAHNRRRCVGSAKRCIHTLTTTPEGGKGY